MVEKSSWWVVREKMDLEVIERLMNFVEWEWLSENEDEYGIIYGLIVITSGNDYGRVCFKLGQQLVLNKLKSKLVSELTMLVFVVSVNLQLGYLMWKELILKLVRMLGNISEKLVIVSLN